MAKRGALCCGGGLVEGPGSAQDALEARERAVGRQSRCNERMFYSCRWAGDDDTFQAWRADWNVKSPHGVEEAREGVEVDRDAEVRTKVRMKNSEDRGRLAKLGTSSDGAEERCRVPIKEARKLAATGEDRGVGGWRLRLDSSPPLLPFA